MRPASSRTGGTRSPTSRRTTPGRSRRSTPTARARPSTTGAAEMRPGRSCPPSAVARLTSSCSSRPRTSTGLRPLSRRGERAGVARWRHGRRRRSGSSTRTGRRTRTRRRRTGTARSRTGPSPTPRACASTRTRCALTRRAGGASTGAAVHRTLRGHDPTRDGHRRAVRPGAPGRRPGDARRAHSAASGPARRPARRGARDRRGWRRSVRARPAQHVARRGAAGDPRSPPAPRSRPSPPPCRSDPPRATWRSRPTAPTPTSPAGPPAR